MIDLIFIGIIAVFIAGMLWSDRDSRLSDYLKEIHGILKEYEKMHQLLQEFLNNIKSESDKT